MDLIVLGYLLGFPFGLTLIWARSSTSAALVCALLLEASTQSMHDLLLEALLLMFYSKLLRLS